MKLKKNKNKNMTQVSKRPLKKEIKEEIFDNFWVSLTNLSNKKEVIDFIDDLLTPTERLMLAKRLMIAALLHRGWRYEAIGDFLKVSGATIASVRLNMEKGGAGFKFTVSKLEKKKSLSKFLARAEKIFAGAPPIVGRGRWRWLYQD